MAPSNIPTRDLADRFGAVCQIEGLLDDGALSVIIEGKPMVVEVAGLPHSMTGAQFGAVMIERILASRIPLRCRIIGPAGHDRSRAQLYFLAWHDKSGDVWQPLTELSGVGDR